ncbi:putative diphthamide synthesis protein-domain-containing protein [Pseudomassariella vexata]|uniref:2-(3-amino-3-carboxypropyl)histidine synthase subunit 2 n=1 Tax=Pseudomassariella vexata TaxID=1141098 RepID=A0A1Y2E640_9PEZI|nr:putative diphthamide synthesis protein-domain-containing protein [Pseudomassariella vexata]ORY66992.1 putative diphthamide synthesis protein-domain-containing protein [Pseudomassariella vexata]
MANLSAPPVLSTPADHIFVEDPTVPDSETAQAKRSDRTDNELLNVYEIARTATEIREKGWKRVALQFPDAMLADAPWVVGALDRELAKLGPLYILADTSYSACCVDEIAAEHADADVVVHYGRACLSPTSRIPVLHIFTRQVLDYDQVVQYFEKEFSEKEDKIIVMADVMFQEHVEPICNILRQKRYSGVIGTAIVRDPTGVIPNRKIILGEGQDTVVAEGCTGPDLHDHHLFHISTPPRSLLLTLSSRLTSLRIYPTPSSPYNTPSELPDPSATPGILRRRYALVIRLATASIIGILVNTLSVKNYLPTITKLKEQIAAAGKKSYTIVVGKLNAAKLANFAEIDGWVVVGCWESGLVEQDGLWKPVITPFELSMALAGDEERIWDGRWWGGIEGVETEKRKEDASKQDSGEQNGILNTTQHTDDVEGGVDDDESEPPEFDLRTGRLVSHSRPMRLAAHNGANNKASALNGEVPRTSLQGSSALVQRKLGELAMVNGIASPGAEFLRSQRTWQGLGSDFHHADEEEDELSTIVEQGRSGVARGYTVGDDASRA